MVPAARSPHGPRHHFIEYGASISGSNGLCFAPGYFPMKRLLFVFILGTCLYIVGTLHNRKQEIIAYEDRLSRTCLEAVGNAYPGQLVCAEIFASFNPLRNPPTFGQD